MKNKKSVEKSKYKQLIEKYLDKNEINRIKSELKKITDKQLMTDKLFFNINRNDNIGRINYIIEELPEVKKKIWKNY